MEIKLTNFLLIFICLTFVAKNNFMQQLNTSASSKSNGITIGKTYKETKSITPIVLNKNKTKHATTFREYIDSDNRSTLSLTHSIRVGKEYYVSTSVNMRKSSYGQQNYGANMSLTKYW